MLLLALSTLLFTPPPDGQTVIVVVGAPGAEEYRSQFQEWAGRWADAAGKANAKLVQIGAEGTGEDDRDKLQQALADAAETAEPLWLVLIGHGTFDGHEAKFNTRGPDFSAAELAEWLKPVERPVAVINCASCSGPFVNALSGPERVIVSGTRSGSELNFCRFGDYMSRAIGNPEADLDKDDQVSLLEAYLSASAGVAEFYKQEARLATEHALLDDNGDGLGTPAAWFHGVRATQAAQEGAQRDGLRANQWHLIRSDRENRMPPELRARRDELELEIAGLRESKSTLSEDAYYNQLRPLLVELATLYEGAEK